MEKEDIVLIVGFIVLLVLFFWYIFGNSPTFEQLILGIFLVNVGLSVKNHGVINKIHGKFEEFKTRFEEFRVRFEEHLKKHN